MNDAWSYVLTPQAEREMRRLSIPVRRRIFEALDRYVAEHHGNVRKLQGKDNEWRLRVGDWRVRYRPDFRTGVIVVLTVRHRSQAYQE